MKAPSLSIMKKIARELFLALFPFEYFNVDDLPIQTPMLSKDIVGTPGLSNAKSFIKIRRHRKSGQYEAYLKCSTVYKKGVPFQIMVTYDWIPLPDDLKKQLDGIVPFHENQTDPAAGFAN